MCLSGSAPKPLPAAPDVPETEPAVMETPGKKVDELLTSKAGRSSLRIDKTITGTTPGYNGLNIPT